MLSGRPGVCDGAGRTVPELGGEELRAWALLSQLCRGPARAGGAVRGGGDRPLPAPQPGRGSGDWDISWKLFVAEGGGWGEVIAGGGRVGRRRAAGGRSEDKERKAYQRSFVTVLSPASFISFL